jgi:hypothetical protein
MMGNECDQIAELNAASYCDCYCRIAGNSKELIAAKLQREFCFKRISPEQLLREQVRAGTRLGQQAEKCVSLEHLRLHDIKQLCTFVDNSHHQSQLPVFTLFRSQRLT